MLCALQKGVLCYNMYTLLWAKAHSYCSVVGAKKSVTFSFPVELSFHDFLSNKTIKDKT